MGAHGAELPIFAAPSIIHSKEALEGKLLQVHEACENILDQGLAAEGVAARVARHVKAALLDYCLQVLAAHQKPPLLSLIHISEPTRPY